jgi:hypothetical protein
MRSLQQRLAEPGEELIPEAGDAAGVGVAFAGKDGGGLADADDAWDVEGTGPQAVFLPGLRPWCSKS